MVHSRRAGVDRIQEGRLGPGPSIMVSPNVQIWAVKERKKWASQTARSLGIKGSQRLLLDYLAYRGMDGSVRGEWARLDRISAELDMPLRTLKWNLARLRDLGAITTTRTGPGPLVFNLDYGSVRQLPYLENGASVAEASPEPSKNLATDLAPLDSHAQNGLKGQLLHPKGATLAPLRGKIRSYSLDRLQTNKEEEEKTTPLPSEDFPSRGAGSGAGEWSRRRVFFR